MVDKILQIFALSCRHRKTTQPFMASDGAIVKKKNSDWDSVGSAGPSHYVVCLDCGRKFAYDWQNMKMLRN